MLGEGLTARVEALPRERAAARPRHAFSPDEHRVAVASRGCLRPSAAPGAAVGEAMRAAVGSITPKYTCPAVSHAASAWSRAASDMLVIGHAFRFHL
jgi:hypothetical protein